MRYGGKGLHWVCWVSPSRFGVGVVREQTQVSLQDLENWLRSPLQFWGGKMANYPLFSYSWIALGSWGLGHSIKTLAFYAQDHYFWTQRKNSNPWIIPHIHYPLSPGEGRCLLPIPLPIEKKQILWLEWSCGIGETAISKFQMMWLLISLGDKHVYPETSCFLMSFKFFSPSCSAAGRNLTSFPFLWMYLLKFNLGLN